VIESPHFSFRTNGDGHDIRTSPFKSHFLLTGQGKLSAAAPTLHFNYSTLLRRRLEDLMQAARVTCRRGKGDEKVGSQYIIRKIDD